MTSFPKNYIRKLSLNRSPFFSYQKIFNIVEYPKNSLFKLVIEWKEGEKVIYLTGCFNKFNKLYLSKSDKKIYTYLKFNLNLNFHKLKFKVYGKIQINSIYLIYGNNNENEKTIDNLKIISECNNKNNSIIVKDSNLLSTKDSSLLSVKKKNDKNLNFAFSLKNYCNYYPKKDEMRGMADKKPCHFPSKCFLGVNQFHNEIGKKDFLYLTDNSIYNNTYDSYKIIERKDHLILNHYLHKNVNNNKIINSFTVKYRHKNSTFIYYK